MNIIRLFILFMCLSACSSENNSPTETSSPVSLTGVKWIWSEYQSSDKTVPPVYVANQLAAEVFQITFHDSKSYSGSDGCNGFAGSWSEIEGSIVLTDKLTTGAACPESLAELSQRFILSTGVGMPYSIDQDNMLTVVLTDNAELVFSIGLN